MRHSMVVFMVSMACVSTAALAAGSMKPGLWEMSMKSDAMKDAMKGVQVPPEQMALMKKMGIKMPEMHNDGTVVTKICISKAASERNALPPTGPHASECQQKDVKMSSSGFSSAYVCNGPNMKGEGTVKGSFTDNSFTSAYDFKGTSGGKPVSMHSESVAKFLGANCGDVKPYNVPQQ